jgi:hypothetical protein
MKWWVNVHQLINDSIINQTQEWLSPKTYFWRELFFQGIVVMRERTDLSSNSCMHVCMDGTILDSRLLLCVCFCFGNIQCVLGPFSSGEKLKTF